MGYETSYLHSNYEPFNSVDDVIMGNLNNDKQVRISETRFKKQGTEGSAVLFSGLFIETTLNTNTRSDIRLISNKVELLRLDNCTEFKTNNLSFEKEFNVYTDNPTITAKILTSAVMEKLILLRTEYGMNYDFVIKGNKLYIRLVTGALFETALQRSTLNKEDLLIYYSILNYVDLLITEIDKIIDASNI